MRSATHVEGPVVSLVPETRMRGISQCSRRRRRRQARNSIKKPFAWNGGGTAGVLGRLSANYPNQPHPLPLGGGDVPLCPPSCSKESWPHPQAKGRDADAPLAPTPLDQREEATAWCPLGRTGSRVGHDAEVRANWPRSALVNLASLPLTFISRRMDA